MIKTVLAIVTLVIGCADQSDDGGGGGGGGKVVAWHYTAGAEALIPFVIDGSLAATPVDGVEFGIPMAFPINAAWAYGETNGGGVLIPAFEWSSTELDDNEAAHGRFEIQIAPEDVAAVQQGSTITADCEVSWEDPLVGNTPHTFGFGRGGCSVSFARGKYTARVDRMQIQDGSGDKGALLSGQVTFSPVPSSPTVFTEFCGAEQVCMSLDPDDLSPAKGWCLPQSNRKADAVPCASDCEEQLTIEAGNTSQCVCTFVCGNVEQAGGPPVCHPAYGCIDV